MTKEGLNTLTGTRQSDEGAPKSGELFESLLEQVNDVLSCWLDGATPPHDAMIAMHVAARRLDGFNDGANSPSASILDFSKAPEGVDWRVGSYNRTSDQKYYAVEIGGVVDLGFTAQEAFDEALAEYERMLEQEAGK